MDLRNLVKNLTKKTKVDKNNIEELEKAIVNKYLDINNINVKKSTFLEDYCGNLDSLIYTKVSKVVESFGNNLNIENLVNIFELLIPEEEKKQNGMVFTPPKVKSFIINELLSDYTRATYPTMCDPSCGCGSLLLTASNELRKRYLFSYEDIYKRAIFGVDIYEHNIEKAKVILTINALENGEIVSENCFNLITADALQLDWKKLFNHRLENRGFDFIIGNPPYVRIKNISESVKDNLKKWYVAQIGNTDLYIPFFQLGIELLNDSGKLGYISINSYLHSLNGRNLRKYLTDGEYNLKIVNFRDNQMFKGVTSYTCITIINKKNRKSMLKYLSLDELVNINNNFNIISVKDLDYMKGWKLGDSKVNTNIAILESFKRKLGDYKIKNGIATLKNELYIFTPQATLDNHYILLRNGKEYLIEKEICRDIIKPNVIKNEEDLEIKSEKLIFPYEIIKNAFSIINIASFMEKFPETYKYLLDIKDELAKRDKGKQEKYPEWYAFGRTQGLNNTGKKILLPYMSKEPLAVICKQEDMLFYCGYALFSEDDNELEFLKKILLSSIFWYYIKHTSKDYSNGYKSFAKNYLKSFSIPDISEQDKEKIINTKDNYAIDNILNNYYNIEF
ncbi:Eco57I restriction-modification methylase domain-containing protein [Clostridium polynesiense]|uniref:Eco57I restriction-modification methylase domain-containing protein n=1 Tax=Clostridium polynesiense TaxID=1325933 RepID=UPI000693D7A4|nr:N-6 DNA methylase [Clostridium polynesiense]